MEINTNNQLCAEVVERGGYLLELGQYYNCKFLVGTETHQEIIESHKLILTLASPVFEAMLYGDLSEKVYPIPIKDIKPETFKILLEYIYTGRLNTSSVDEICNLCYAAKKYLLEHLLIKCAEYLSHHANMSNVWQLYEMALLFEAKQLLQKCEKIISTNTKDALNDSNFGDVQLSTVAAAFSLDNLNIDTELELIEAVVRYGRFQCRSTIKQASIPLDDELLVAENSLITSASDNDIAVAVGEGKTDVVMESGMECDELPGPSELQPISEDIMSEIRMAVQRIRFLSLTPQQFAECSLRTMILTVSEQHAVMMNIASPKSEETLPSGLSTCRIGRHRMSELGSSIDEARAEAIFTYTIRDFRNVTEVTSPPCYVRNIPWYLRYSHGSIVGPDGQLQEGVTFAVRCDLSNMPNWSSNVTVQLTFISQNESRENITAKKFTHMYSREKFSMGPSFKPKALCTMLDRGYLKNGAFTIQAHIKVESNGPETQNRASILNLL